MWGPIVGAAGAVGRERGTVYLPLLGDLVPAVLYSSQDFPPFLLGMVRVFGWETRDLCGASEKKGRPKELLITGTGLLPGVLRLSEGSGAGEERGQQGAVDQ